MGMSVCVLGDTGALIAIENDGCSTVKRTEMLEALNTFCLTKTLSPGKFFT